MEPGPVKKDFEVVSPPDDSVSALEFSPSTQQKCLLVAGSWDCSVRCWEVEQTSATVPRSMQAMGGPVLDVCWSSDGTKVFAAGGDNQVKLWDLASNQVMQVAAHDAAVRTCHVVRGANYTCLMTGSWDRTLKFWDTLSPYPVATISLPERCYCAAVDYPMAVVGVGNREIITYELQHGPMEYKRLESPLPCQQRAVAIIRNEKKEPAGFALGGITGRVAIQYISPKKPTDNYTFRCHRSVQSSGEQDVYAVNDIAVHSVHGTLATVGSDGRLYFWDKDSRTKLLSSKPMDQSITKCCFNANGQIFAYAVGYDWSKGYMYFNPAKKPQIFFRACYDELRPSKETKFKVLYMSCQ